ncbi:MAG: aminoglycoside phosphotransferase family protein [Thermomicrobiales bacterium]|nr:aminoglycoside phosphotransferase family protein [Thermomicrobiales bacterium]
MEERFSDGNMFDVVRIGDRVRKQKSSWWQATATVLNHLESAGYPYSPRVLDIDEDSLYLSFIPGDTIPADLAGFTDPAWLIEMGKQIRALHEALDGLVLTEATMPIPTLPDGHAMACHCDLGPWNIVVQGGAFSGFIDWDLVAMGTREWDLAYACWRWAPIYPETGSAEEQASRCQLLLQSYGTDLLDLNGFVDLIDLRMQAAIDVVDELGSQGVPGFANLYATGAHLGGQDDRAWLAANRDTFIQIIESQS